jgi:AraC family transcriptional regulator
VSGVHAVSQPASLFETPPGSVMAAVTGPRRAVIERVLSVMRAQPGEPLRLTDLAEIAALSPFHFARTFRQVTGSPPGEFLAALRLEQAKSLLLTTDMRVTDICFEVGYNSLGTFTSRFTQHVGLPPARLRQLAALGDLADADPRARPHIRPAARGGVAGWIGGAPVSDPLIFVGLFPAAIPQGWPVAGTVLTAPGPFWLPAPPDGVYHLRVAAVPEAHDPLALLLPDDRLRVGVGDGVVLIRNGRVTGSTAITLRPRCPTDPPILIALPALLTRDRARRAG